MTKLSTLPFKKIDHFKKHITLLTYLLPCPAAHVSITSSQSSGHRMQLIAQLMESTSSRLCIGQRMTFWALTTC